MKLIRLGKRKRFTNETSQTLAQGIVPTLNMSGFTGFFANRMMFSGQMTENCIVGLPKVTEGGTMTVRAGNPRPQAPTIFFGTPTDKVGNNLASAPTECYPDPAFVFFEPTKDQSSSNSRTSPGCAGSSGGKSGSWLSSWRNQLATVWRDTPKVRSRPRKLERS